VGCSTDVRSDRKDATHYGCRFTLPSLIFALATGSSEQRFHVGGLRSVFARKARQDATSPRDKIKLLTARFPRNVAAGGPI